MKNNHAPPLLTKRDTKAIEPEVLPSLDAVDSPGAQGQPGPIQLPGCTVGPGCGCIGLPLALLAGAVISAFMALLWLLSLGRVPVSVVRMAQRMRRGGPRG